MIRAMYSGISGMKVNQTKLDVTGNNIANVGTTGFKGSRVRFQDMLSQNVSEALGPGRNTGGVNPRQVGLGVQVAGIDTVVTQGMMQPTSRNLDAAVDGEGYFIVAKGPIPESNAQGISVSANDHTMSGGNLEVSYTRDGAFTLDHAGNLLTSDGYRVMGYAISEIDENNNAKDVRSVDYNSNGAVNFVDADAKYGLKANDTLVPLRIPDSIRMKATNIGTANPVGMDYNTGERSIKQADGTSKTVTEPKIDTAGNDYLGKEDLKIEVKYNVDTTTPENSAFHVYINGNDTGKKPGEDIERPATPPTPAEEALNQLPAGFKINVSEPNDVPTGDESKYSWSFTLKAEGNKKIRSFSMEKEGLIKAVLDDGSVSALGQIALTSFKNPGGLKKLGKNLYQNTANSGQPIVKSGAGAPKNLDNSDGYGEVLQGMLEMSNVDLAEQFTDMIVTTRAFQASGKMITTGDEILQDIINLKR